MKSSRSSQRFAFITLAPLSKYRRDITGSLLFFTSNLNGLIFYSRTIEQYSSSFSLTLEITKNLVAR